MRRYIAILTEDTDTKQIQMMTQDTQGHWISKDISEEVPANEETEALKWLASNGIKLPVTKDTLLGKLASLFI